MKTQYSQSYLLLFVRLSVFFFVSFLIITSSKVYADQYDITQDNIDQFFTHYSDLTWFNNVSTATLKSRMESKISQYYSTYDSTIIYLFKDGNTYKLYMLFFNKSQITSFSYTSVTSWTISSNGYNIREVFLNNNDDYRVVSWSGKPGGIYFLINNDLGSLVGPFQNIDVINTSSYIPLTFLPRLSDINADVWTYEDIPVYRFSGDEDLYIGQLYQPISSNCYETNNNFFYMWGTWQYRDLTPFCTYTEYIGSDELGSTYDVYLVKDYFYTNTLYNLVWTDTSTDPYTLAAANFYLGDQNTVIINGVIDPSKTFSGDYKDQYDYENDPNQNFWKDTYNRFMTPSGEVLRGTITSLMSDLDFTTSGEESGELMMALVGLDVISNDFGDFIISWDDFDPHLSVKGQTITPMSDGNILQSSGHFIPAGQINFSQMERNNETFHNIMEYTRAILSFTVISLFFSNLWHTLLITLGISTQIYEKDQQAKEKMARQAERDQRRQEREDRNRYQQWLYEHRR